MSTLPRGLAQWHNHFADRGPGPTAEAWLLRLAEIPAATQRAALVGLPDMRTLLRRFEAAWEHRQQPLGGVPFLAKDLFHLAGTPTRAGTTFLADILETPQHDSELLQIAQHQAGAVCCGKTQLNELAFGLSGENPHVGNCPHPQEATRLSGGSSSGSAWAVGVGLVPFALATDTAGSIRVPATHCGVFGLRLPVGHHTSDIFPLAPSYDTAGWITGSAVDLSLLTQELMGAPTQTIGKGLWLGAGNVSIPTDILKCQHHLARTLGAEEDAQLAAELTLAFAAAGDAYACLGSWEAAQVHAHWLNSHAEALDPNVRARLQAGAGRTLEARQAAAAIQSKVRNALDICFQAGWDWIALPCTRGPAVRLGHHDNDERCALLQLNAPATLAGLGVVALPVPLSQGLTAGIQLIARDWATLQALAQLPREAKI